VIAQIIFPSNVWIIPKKVVSFVSLLVFSVTELAFLDLMDLETENHTGTFGDAIPIKTEIKSGFSSAPNDPLHSTSLWNSACSDILAPYPRFTTTSLALDSQKHIQHTHCKPTRSEETAR
jgi:hypothetical protein